MFSLGPQAAAMVAVVELAQKQKSGQQVRLRVTAQPAVRIEKALSEEALEAVTSVAT